MGKSLAATVAISRNPSLSNSSTRGLAIDQPLRKNMKIGSSSLKRCEMPAERPLGIRQRRRGTVRQVKKSSQILHTRATYARYM